MCERGKIIVVLLKSIINQNEKVEEDHIYMREREKCNSAALSRMRSLSAMTVTPAS